MIVCDFPIGNPFDASFDREIYDRISKSIQERFGVTISFQIISELLQFSTFFAPVFAVNQAYGCTHLALSSSIAFSMDYSIFILYRPELSLQENMEYMVIRFVKLSE